MATKSPEVIKHSRSQVEALVKKHKLSTKQRVVLSRLMVGGQQPPQIAKAMKISVNGVYGHMRRIEKAGVDLSRFRSSNGSSTKPRARRRSASRNGYSPGVTRFLKNLDDEEGALKDEANDLDQEITIAKAKIISAEQQRTHVGHALAGIGAARKRVTRK